MSREVRRSAQPVGSRTLEMHAGTPAINDWYYSKLRGHVRGRVLELGSGIGNISRLLAHDADELVLTDVEDEYLARLRNDLGHLPQVCVARFDLDLPPPPEVASGRFDAIVSLNVLEHVADDRRAIAELASLLAPGGWLLTYVPAASFAFGTLDEALGHHRRYDAGVFADLMREAGLVTERLEYMNALGLVGWIVNGRLLRKRVLDHRLVGVFERILPIVRLEDRLRLPIGLGLICHARKPG